jgi:HD-GYP domain-containing protein (c-di-GMP phosphodiesterase class II)
MSPRLRRYPLHVYLSFLFSTLMFIFLVVAIIVNDHGTKRILLATARSQFSEIANNISQGVQWGYGSTIGLAELLSTSEITQARSLPERMKRIAILAQPLRGRNIVSAAYVGYANGDFFLVRRLVRGSELARSLKAPAATAYLVQSISVAASGEREGRYLFLGESLQLLENRLMPDYSYDPRVRPWFRDALTSVGPTITDAYAFFTTGEAGVTVARRKPDGEAVVAVDIPLSSLSQQLDRARPTQSAQLVIFDDHGSLIADADGTLPTMPPETNELRLRNVSELREPALSALFAKRPPAGSRMLEIEQAGGTWQGLVAAISPPGAILYVAVAAPQSELLASAIALRNQGLIVALALLGLGIACTILVSHYAARKLDALTAEAAQIRSLKFDRPVTVRSFIAEIDTLAVTLAQMKATIQRFLDICASLAGERRFDRLLDRILTETVRLASARGGFVYLSGPDGILRCELAKWEDQVIENSAHTMDPRRHADHPALRAIREGAVSVVAARSELTELFPILNERDALAILAVPLSNRQGSLLGVLVLFQAAEVFKGAEQHDVVALVEAVSGAAAAALDTQKLILDQKRLLEGLIELVADAIDRKSPYTGGHCQRVPDLTKMLARAAQAATEGPFAQFTLNEAQWEELHIAAWLHDCGKVTSPEYVVDKATKLETICDRLHEVRMRFEVVKREAEVACWQAIAAGADSGAQLAELRRLWADLDEEFAFVAGCNEGGEYMAPEKIQRLHRIAERTWTRTLDDRTGLSEEEKRRKMRSPALPLPVTEPLLADRPEHIFERRDADRLSPENPWGFKIEVPEHLYNRGELYNLSISRGTLTAEDRYKINEHMVETIRMLSRLPFPSHLKNVVEIAGGHHEKMDGTGYPRRLSRGEMSVPARMMAIADIFEALTAADRPYKKGKTLTEALSIMSRMRDEQHIDAELFELFLRAAVYREFADKYLPSAQIDDVDIERYLEQPATAGA